MKNKTIQLSDASRRNTPSRWVTIGGIDILFSYETPVAFRDSKNRYRVENTWGPTTGKHISEAGASNWPVLPDEEFNQKLTESIKAYFARTDETD